MAFGLLREILGIRESDSILSVTGCWTYTLGQTVDSLLVALRFGTMGRTRGPAKNSCRIRPSLAISEIIKEDVHSLQRCQWKMTQTLQSLRQDRSLATLPFYSSSTVGRRM